MNDEDTHNPRDVFHFFVSVMRTTGLFQTYETLYSVIGVVLFSISPLLYCNQNQVNCLLNSLYSYDNSLPF